MTDAPKEKTNKELLKEIWDAQGLLNKTVGIDTLALAESNMQMDLVTDYLDEAANELFECKENIMHKWWVKEVKENKDNRFNIMDMSKVKLELIDALHFLTSAAHLTKFHFYEFYDEFVYRTRDIKLDKRGFYLLLNRLIGNCINRDMGLAFTNLVNAFTYLKMDVKEIHKIYFLKNKANFERQKNNYSIATKTEDDNHEIEKVIDEKPKGSKKRK